MNHTPYIKTAWFLGWLVYLIAAVLTVFDGFPSFIFQPIIAAVVSALAVVASALVGLIFRIPPIGRIWHKAWFLAPTLALGSILLMCFGTALGFTEKIIDPESGQQITILRPVVGFCSYLTMIFTIANWPAKPMPATPSNKNVSA